MDDNPVSLSGSERDNESVAQSNIGESEASVSDSNGESSIRPTPQSTKDQSDEEIKVLELSSSESEGIKD